MQKVVGVIFNDAGKTYFYDPGNEEYIVGEYVIVESESDCVMAKIDFVDKIDDSKIQEPLKMVIRLHR